jgi:hypothetical protein
MNKHRRRLSAHPGHIWRGKQGDDQPCSFINAPGFRYLAGRMVTLFTTANIVVSGNATRDCRDLACWISPQLAYLCRDGIIYMLVLGRRWLPNQSPKDRLMEEPKMQGVYSRYTG